MNVTAVLLAAGASRRMGALKQLLPLGGRPLVQVALDHLVGSQVDRILVVLGCEADRVERALTLPSNGRVRVIRHEGWESGMAGSLVAGLEAAGDPEALLVALGDLPMIPPRVIDRLLAVASRTDRTIVAPSYEGRQGHPVLFRRVHFDELRALDGDTGAARVLKAHPDRLHLVPVDSDGILRDVDLPFQLMEAAEAQG